MKKAKTSSGTAELVAKFAEGLPAELMPQIAWQDKLVLYLDRLAAYNRSFNLVGPENIADILASLVPDSFQLAAMLARLPLPENPLALDCGAGAGLPGIPLRMIWQPGKYTMIEQRRKRALFLENVLAELHLPGTGVFTGDAFKVAEPADLIISRAWMPVPKILDYCAARLADGGFAIIFARDAALPVHADFENFLEIEYSSPTGKRKIRAARRGRRI